MTIAFLDSGFTPHSDPGDRIAAYHDASGDDSPLDPAGPPEGWRWHGTQTSTAAAGDGRLSDRRYRGLVLVVAAGNGGCSERPRPIPPANAPSVITVGEYDDHNWLLDPEVIAPARWVAAPILAGSREAERAEALCALAEAADFELPSRFRTLGEAAGVSGAGQGATVDEIRARVERGLRDARVIAPHYQHVDGTPFAAPIVASVVAQMLEANPRLTPAAIKALPIATPCRVLAPRISIATRSCSPTTTTAQPT